MELWGWALCCLLHSHWSVFNSLGPAQSLSEVNVHNLLFPSHQFLVTSVGLSLAATTTRVLPFLPSCSLTSFGWVILLSWYHIVSLWIIHNKCASQFCIPDQICEEWFYLLEQFNCTLLLLHGTFHTLFFLPLFPVPTPSVVLILPFHRYLPGEAMFSSSTWFHFTSLSCSSWEGFPEEYLSVSWGLHALEGWTWMHILSWSYSIEPTCMSLPLFSSLLHILHLGTDLLHANPICGFPTHPNQWTYGLCWWALIDASTSSFPVPPYHSRLLIILSLSFAQVYFCCCRPMPSWAMCKAF